MYDQLAILYAKRMIQRRDVKAVQFRNGGYSPDRELKHLGTHGPLGFELKHLTDHMEGKATYGHYLLDRDSNARMFAFDIDLAKTGWWCPLPPIPGAEQMTEEQFEAYMYPQQLGNPQDPTDSTLRKAWLDRAHPSRNWLKMQMGAMARRFTKAIIEETGYPCAAAYTGNKGIHVYGFTGPMPASHVRAAATYVIESMGDWKLVRGNHIYGHKVDDPRLGYQNFTIEVYPKQDSLEDKDLGNLMRLPLGRNLKSEDPTFFLDLTTPVGVMAPHPDPVRLLDSGNPYE